MKVLAGSLRLAAALVAVFVAASALCQPIPAANARPTAQEDQGCVNQGSDRREFGPVICWMQREMSWKSEHEPYFTLIGKPDGTNLGLAWPPYVVLNIPDGKGRWRMFRAGFRYDRAWRGYIFPSVAAKSISHPLRY